MRRPPRGTTPLRQRHPGWGGPGTPAGSLCAPARVPLPPWPDSLPRGGGGVRSPPSALPARCLAEGDGAWCRSPWQWAAWAEWSGPQRGGEGARAPGRSPPPPPFPSACPPAPRCLCQAAAERPRPGRGAPTQPAAEARSPRACVVSPASLPPPHPAPFSRHGRLVEERARRLVRCLRGGHGGGGGDAAGAGGEAVPVRRRRRRRGAAGERAVAGRGHPRRLPAGLPQPRPGGKSRVPGRGGEGGCGGAEARGLRGAPRAGTA